MKRFVKTGDAGTCSFARGFVMRGKIIIRIRRKNEFNGYWVFLVILAGIFGIVSLEAENRLEFSVVVWGASVILLTALLYQGIEVIRE
jgi:hypothetical protein